MTAAHCRIGKVRLKNGAEVTVLDRPVRSKVVDELMVEVRRITDEEEMELQGYVLIGLYDKSTTKTAVRAWDGFPMRLMPEYAAETIRRVMWDG